MNKHIAIVVGVLIVLGAFFGDNLQKSNGRSLSYNFANALSFSLPEELKAELEVPQSTDVDAKTAAWTRFEQYLEALRTHNLAQVRELSHQTSPLCQNPETAAQCYSLMDSAYFFAKDFKQADFVNVASDNLQIVLSTNYLLLEGSELPIKTVIYFTRGTQGEPKVLGIRFCVREVDSTEDKCVETDPSKRDMNQNGWWDDVEAMFK